jgi:hypothetical protein
LQAYSSAEQQSPVNGPSLGLLVAGFSTDADLAEIYRIEIDKGACSAPILSKGENETGYLWYGQPEALNRLLRGYDARLPAVFRGLLQQGGFQGDLDATVAQIMSQVDSLFEIPLYTPPMPIQDAIDLANFLVQTAIGFTRFRPGSPTVGGPTEIATVTKHDGFKWIKHKRYYDDRWVEMELWGRS